MTETIVAMAVPTLILALFGIMTVARVKAVKQMNRTLQYLATIVQAQISKSVLATQVTAHGHLEELPISIIGRCHFGGKGRIDDTDYEFTLYHQEKFGSVLLKTLPEHAAQKKRENPSRTTQFNLPEIESAFEVFGDLEDVLQFFATEANETLVHRLRNLGAKEILVSAERLFITVQSQEEQQLIELLGLLKSHFTYVGKTQRLEATSAKISIQQKSESVLNNRPPTTRSTNQAQLRNS